jgi:hypothetical protein
MRLAHVIADDSVRVNFYIGMTAWLASHIWGSLCC